MPPQTNAVTRRAHHRDDDEVVAAARRSTELMRQFEDSLREEERGEKPVPFRDILAAQREGRST